MLLSSCHSLVEDVFENHMQLPVMNSLLLADSTFRVQISLSAGLSDSLPDFVSNAEVVIESNVDSPDTLVYADKGWYVSSRTVRAGGDYSCKATIPGYSIISAQTTVPLPTEIGSVKYIESASRSEEGDRISSVEFTIPNEKTSRKFWEVRLISEGIQSDYNFETGEWIEYFGSINKEIYMLAGQDTVLLNEANPLTLFSNEFITGSSYKVKFFFNATYTQFNDTDTPFIILRSVDESYYKYLKQYYIYSTSGSTNLGQTPQKYPLYSNVKNGLGMFTGVSVYKKEFTLKAGN